MFILMNENIWELTGRSIKDNIPVKITVRNQNVLTLEPKDFFAPMPSRLLGFARPQPEDGDEAGETRMITSGRSPEVSYEQATEGGVNVVGVGHLPYFYGAGSYELILGMTVDSFKEAEA